MSDRFLKTPQQIPVHNNITANCMSVHISKKGSAVCAAYTNSKNLRNQNKYLLLKWMQNLFYYMTKDCAEVRENARFLYLPFLC